MQTITASAAKFCLMRSLSSALSPGSARASAGMGLISAGGGWTGRIWPQPGARSFE